MMYKGFGFDHGFGMGDLFGWMLFSPIVVWTLVWKGLALWKSARREDKVWFIVLLVLNTFGILEIFYIYLFSKDKTKKVKK